MIDIKSKQNAYALYERLSTIEVGTTKGLQQIHAFIFGGLYDFAGKIRMNNISKDGFVFANCEYLKDTLQAIDNMQETTFEQVVDKYIEMNIAHPFLEGNGRSTRIWLDLILKRQFNKCIDWSKINKSDYLNAMKKSVVDTRDLYQLLFMALSNETTRELFIKGIDYSYYYEEID